MSAHTITRTRAYHDAVTSVVLVAAVPEKRQRQGNYRQKGKMAAAPPPLVVFPPSFRTQWMATACPSHEFFETIESVWYLHYWVGRIEDVGSLKQFREKKEMTRKAHTKPKHLQYQFRSRAAKLCVCFVFPIACLKRWLIE